MAVAVLSKQPIAAQSKLTHKQPITTKAAIYNLVISYRADTASIKTQN